MFRYFEHPHKFSTYREEPKPCDLCGWEVAGYDAGAFRGARDVERVCEVWPGIRPDAPTNVRDAYSVGTCLFRCLVCREHILM
jgi:hypothetical protein